MSRTYVARELAFDRRVVVKVRLGELHEAKGQRAQAIAHHERFVTLWADAEPVLQPKVREVNAKLDRLRAAEKR